MRHVISIVFRSRLLVPILLMVLGSIFLLIASNHYSDLCLMREKYGTFFYSIVGGYLLSGMILGISVMLRFLRGLRSSTGNWYIAFPLWLTIKTMEIGIVFFVSIIASPFVPLVWMGYYGIRQLSR